MTPFLEVLSLHLRSWFPPRSSFYPWGLDYLLKVSLWSRFWFPPWRLFALRILMPPRGASCSWSPDSLWRWLQSPSTLKILIPSSKCLFPQELTHSLRCPCLLGLGSLLEASLTLEVLIPCSRHPYLEVLIPFSKQQSSPSFSLSSASGSLIFIAPLGSLDLMNLSL